jgi:hypothetical protein
VQFSVCHTRLSINNFAGHLTMLLSIFPWRTSMSNIILLADVQAELIGGGYKAPSITKVTNFTGIKQSNNVTNVGIGLWGFGYAGSIQGNNAEVANFIKA